MKKTIALLLVVFISSVLAQDNDTYKLRLGGYLVGSQNSEIRADSNNINGIGTVLNLQDLFNMDEAQQVFRIEGRYRFNEHHSIEAAWYSINSNGNNQADQNFSIPDGNGGQTEINAGARISSYLNTDIYKVNYLYSFYHTDEVELSIGAGLHIMQIGFGLDGTYNTGSGDQDIGDNSGSIATTAPLPVVSFRLEYMPMEDLYVNYNSDVFFVSFDGVSGTFTDTTLTAEYYFTKHFGLGGGVNTTRMNLSIPDDNVDWKMSHNVLGAIAYLSVKY